MLLKYPMPEPGRPLDRVAAVQEMLRALGHLADADRGPGVRLVPLAVDGLYGPMTESAVTAFQEEEGLLADGIVGPTTMEALEDAYARRHVELASPGEGAAPGAGTVRERLPLVRVATDAWGQGYGRIALRADAAAKLERVREALHEHGALLTSSGGIRGLRARVSPSRSATSMHYVGRAVDLFVGSGMNDPERDPFVVRPRAADPLPDDRGDHDRRWTVYARCGHEGPLAAWRRFGDAVTYRDREGGAACEGLFLNVTALFAEHGFRAIRARRSFARGGGWLGAEWWHFQYEGGLVPGVSTFGAELLRTYPRARVEATPPWRFRDRVFGENWF